MTGVVADLNFIYFTGLLVAAGAMCYPHQIVGPDDLSRIHVSFFAMNGPIRFALLPSTWPALAV